MWLVKMISAAMLLSIAVAVHAQTITVYASGPRGLDRHLAAAFEKSTGVHVNLWASSTGKVLARLQAEQNHPHADVIILADWSAGLALQSEHLIEPYRPEAILARLRTPLNLPADFIPMGADTVALVVNTQRLPANRTPKDWFVLTHSAYRHQVSMPSPMLSGTAADFVLGFLQQNGKKSWAYFKKLKRNGEIWPGPNAAALRPVLLGARSILMAGVGHTSLKAEQRGDSLTLIFPRSGTLLIPRPIVILRSSPHKTLAKQFVNYVLSNAGQKLVASALLIPAVNSVKPNPLWPNLDKVAFWKMDWAKASVDRDVVLQRFDREVIH